MLRKNVREILVFLQVSKAIKWPGRLKLGKVVFIIHMKWIIILKDQEINTLYKIKLWGHNQQQKPNQQTTHKSLYIGGEKPHNFIL